MTLWIGIAVVGGATLLFALWPLFRKATGEAARSEHDLAVYRQQLVDVDADEARGAMDSAEAEAARIEIKRRILKVADGGEQKVDSLTASRPVVAAITVALVGGGALLAYASLGAPGMPDRPLEQRLAEAKGRPQIEGLTPEQVEDLERQTIALEKRLDEEEGTFDNWWLLGRSWFVLQRYDKASEAYNKASGLEPGRPDVLAAWGEALVAAAGNMVTPEARKVFARLAEVEPRDPRARFYFGLAEAQADRYEQSIAIWLDLLKDSEPDAPWVELVRQNITNSARALGRDPEAILPDMTETVRGPTAEDMEAAKDMTADEQQEMIAGMVERLTERLAENPDDLRGWQMLIRSRTVLGDMDGAAESLAAAMKQFPDGDANASLIQLATSLGLAVPGN